MEANKEQAEVCCQLAKKALNGGDLEKAIRLFKKSINMYPTPETRTLLYKAEIEFSTRQRVQERTATPTTPRERSAQTEARPFTPKQQREIDRIITNKEDYYKVLNCTKESTKNEIEKNYKKVAVIIHPDKNGHPRAVEAIKILNEAKECLSETRSRQIYDFTGRNPAHNNTPTRPARSYNRASPYGDADPLFQFIFNSPGGYRTHYSPYQRTYTRQRAERSNEGEKDSFIYTLFVLFISTIFIFLFFSSSQSKDPRLYQFTPTSEYFEEKITANGAKYYHKHLAKQTNFAALEREVDIDWLAYLKARCADDQKNREYFSKLARTYRNYDDGKRYQEKADSISDKFCDEYTEFRKKLNKGAA